MEKKLEDGERFFSIELRSKTNLKNFALTDGSSEVVLVEGSIGELVQATFAEGMILEIVGKQGAMSINLKRSELKGENQSVVLVENLKKENRIASHLESESREVKQCKH
jgi:hypothetical protein